MNRAPETRPSLIVRLRDRGDGKAWDEFSTIYRPVIYRAARRRGLQDADAEDLTQEVLAAVARAVDRWEPDPARGRFRAWLRTITHNAIINALTRRAPDRAAGGSGEHAALANLAARNEAESALLEADRRGEVFRWAAEQVRREFQASTWEAFWRTAVENEDVESVARRLGRNHGAIYAARSRVMRRLRERVREFEDEE